MPTTKSAAKRLKQSEGRRLRNKATKTSLKTNVRKVLEAAEAGKVEEAEQQFRRTAKILDRAGAKNVIHRNKASRQKSRLQRVLKAAKQRTP
jgi:small subunit ribosomal protein S20